MMKSIALILLIVFTSVAQCQTANVISETEFNDIEINGNKLIDIKDTYGNQNAMALLFGVADETIIDSDGEFHIIHITDLALVFQL
ncbi:hypothetical protein [Mangrovimonas spongiae]|uniref:Uncharacterized protein n=1 Tax=Mangrovimonas spongiae TaxID=2494697 RepID=A0A3R9MBF4_9FLAO|nr:hypothetical protein [Mangrovimonas spongiae]RSK41777.1 hypothetical protein EJA19_02540 [Mangrovimonas spongiae]